MKKPACDINIEHMVELYYEMIWPIYAIASIGGYYYWTYCSIESWCAMRNKPYLIFPSFTNKFNNKKMDIDIIHEKVLYLHDHDGFW